MTRPDPETRAKVLDLDARGVNTTQIARQLGIQQSRVERILDVAAGGDVVPITGTPTVAPAAATKPDSPIRSSPKRVGGRAPAKCGTPSGYTKHLRNGEKACDDCKAASAAAKREQVARRRAEQATAAAAIAPTSAAALPPTQPPADRVKPCCKPQVYRPRGADRWLSRTCSGVRRFISHAAALAAALDHAGAHRA